MADRTRTMYSRNCAHCDKVFSARVKGQRFCSAKCSGLGTAPTPESRCCVVCGSTFWGIRTRTTCSPGCYTWSKKRPGVKPPDTCGRCGDSLVGKPLGTEFCSRPCLRAAWAVKTGRARQFRQPRVTCSVCGQHLGDSRFKSVFCSRSCQALRAHERRSAKRSRAPIDRVDPGQIFQRDNWVCHICGKQIDPLLKDKHPMMVSLDHVIPVSDPAYPGHIAANLAAAHLRCNISKHNRARPADWELFNRLRGVGTH